MKMSKDMKNKYKIICIILLIAYSLFTIYFLFFAESMGRTTVNRGYRYNLEPGKEIMRFIHWAKMSPKGIKSMILNIFGNIACFIPFGIMIPMIFYKMRKILPTAFICIILSGLIEVVQLITKTGSFDVDDIILNGLGGIIGIIIYKVCVKVQKSRGLD